MAGTPKGKRAKQATTGDALPRKLSRAGKKAVSGVKHRQDVGHRKAGRVAASPKGEPGAGTMTRVDDAIRGDYSSITEDEKLLQNLGGAAASFTHNDTWRVMRILGEFIEGFDTLADAPPTFCSSFSSSVTEG